MSLFVVTGGTCKCSFGTGICTINATTQTTVMSEGKPVVTITDNQIANIKGFVMCTSLANPQVQAATTAAMGVLTPQPCIPACASPWMGGSSILVGGKPAVTGTSTLMCSKGQGQISIVSTGQEKVIIQ